MSKITVRLKPMEQYSYKKKAICKCRSICATVVQFVRNNSDEVEFVLCESDAKQLGIDILIQTKYMKVTGSVGQKELYHRNGFAIKMWTASEETRLRELYNEDLKIKQIAQKLDRTIKSVERRLGVLRRANKLYVIQDSIIRSEEDERKSSCTAE